MTIRILIMGLPGAGKTTLAKALQAKLNAAHLNADEVRAKFDDWDFSAEGRIRQANRMRNLAEVSSAYYIIADFVAPLQEMRDIFEADYTIWVDTIKTSRFEDTNAAFVPPSKYNIRVTEQDCTKWCEIILKEIT